MRGVVVVLLLFTPIFFAEPKEVDSRVDQAKPVTVMSFNIRYGTAADGENHWVKRREFLVETILAYGPDLLGTQETLAFQRDYLSEKMPGYQVWSAGRDDGKEKGEMAALYWRTERFERLAGGHFWLSKTPDQPGSKGWDAALPRVASWVKLRDKLRPDAKPLLFLNTHFDHRGAQARAESARLIRTQLAELGSGCTLIVTGDFNAGEGSAPYRTFFGEEAGLPRLRDTFRVVHPERGQHEGTFNGFKPTATTGARIDWIACSPDWSVRAAAIDHTQRDGRVPSDHFPVTATLVLEKNTAADPDAMRPTAEIISLKRIWDQAPHNAFTDLVYHQGRWWCVFREGQSHVSPDGVLRIITSEDGSDWQSAARIAWPSRRFGNPHAKGLLAGGLRALMRAPRQDLRDAKLSVTPDGRLMLIGAAAMRPPYRNTHQTYAWFSQDGFNWSQPTAVGDKNIWLWRVTWHEDHCYGVGYACGSQRGTRLYRSVDGKQFETWVDSLFSVGYPNETSLVFLPSGEALCLLRRDPDVGMLGRSQPPYREWKWQQLDRLIGGPHLLRLPDGRLVAGVRLYDKKVRTALAWLEPESGQVTEFLTLPSGGDTSYPGLVWHHNELWVSYYSSHEGKTAIYLARVRFPAL